MRRFFEDPERRLAFERILRAWEGTPYRHQCCVRGRGADCSLFLGQAFVEMGVLRTMSYDYYPRDWHKHGREEVFLKNLRSNIEAHLAEGLQVLELPPDEPLFFGDWTGMAFRSTGVSNHSGVMLGEDRMIHAIQGQGVHVTEFAPWRRHHTITFRVLER